MTLTKIYFDCFWSNAQITDTTVKTSYNNDAYYIGSGEQASKMRRDNAPDLKPEENYYASIYNHHVSPATHSAGALTFPHPTAENRSKESAAPINQPPNGAATAPVYQPITGDVVPIYQSLSSDTKIADARFAKPTN